MLGSTFNKDVTRDRLCAWGQIRRSFSGLSGPFLAILPIGARTSRGRSLFSKSGFWLEWKREGLDPDASLLQAYTRVLAEARPRRFVLENVYTLTYNNKASKPAYERLLREIDAAGYQCKAKVLNAADYGVPQSRPRLFTVSSPKGESVPDHPKPSYGGQRERRISGDPQRPHVTTGEALAGLVTDLEPGEEVNGKYGHLLPDIPPGDNYLFYTNKRGHPRRCSRGAASTGHFCSS
jgi:DNA (cytosine-5)-methyltransferase 1